MPPVLVVIGRVDEPVFFSIECSAFERIEEGPPRVRDQGLRGKSCLLVDPQSRIDAAQLVISIDESVIGCEQSNEGIFLSDIALQTQDTDRGILVDEPRIGGEAVFGTEISRSVIRRQQQAKSIAIDFARELD